MKEIWGIKKFVKGDQEKTFWTRIGIAHECKDGSLNCFFDYVPAIGSVSINIRDPKPKDAAPAKGEEAAQEEQF